MQDKIAIITGGSKGIGKAIAIKLARENAKVAIIYGSDIAAAQKTKQEINEFGGVCSIYNCDVSCFEKTKAVTESILKEFGKVDILINNAGITKDGLILTMTESDFDKVISVNLKGVFNMIKHLYKNFMKNRYGRIINVSSISGIDGNVGQANYSASKAGLIGLTKSVAKELASRNVTCNVIAPGMVETEMTSALNESIKAAAIERTMLKRTGTPEEIAAAAVFLASTEASFITGQVLRVDGGLSI